MGREVNLVSFKKVKLILLDILSFGSPQAIVFNLSLVLLILASVTFGYLKYSPFKCVFKHIIFPIIFRGKGGPVGGLFAGCSCPACGLTRGMWALLHGDIWGALHFNKFVILVFLIMAFLIVSNIVQIIRKYKKENLYL